MNILSSDNKGGGTKKFTRAIFVFGWLLTLGMSGAAFGEVNNAKEFDPKLVATLQKMLDPNRYYPDLKNHPDFYVEMPAMSGTWAGEINGGFSSGTTGYRINLISKYAPGVNVHTWFGIDVQPSTDGNAFSVSQNKFDPESIVWKQYSVGFGSHLNFQKGMSVRFESWPGFDELHPSWDWPRYLVTPLVTRLMNSLYEFMEFDSGATKFCEQLVIRLESDYTFNFEESVCEYAS